MTREDRYEQAGKTAVMQNVHGTISFLLAYPPFNQMEHAHLAWLVEHAQLRFYAAGEHILDPQDGPVEQFFIVKQGLIRGERLLAGQQETDTTFEISTGECFPLAALLGERETRTLHLAGEDTFCFTISRADFVSLFRRSLPFRDFALRGVSSLLDQVNLQAQQQASESLGSHYSLDTGLAELTDRKPVTCELDTPIRAAVRLMHEASVGSIVITDAAQRPLGIFTLRDLRGLIADAATDLEQPISQVMTANPSHLPSCATAFDAAIAMTSKHIAHICLVDNGRLTGVVSERDLFSLQRVDLVHIARTLREAPNLETLIALRSGIRRLVDSMLAHGASSTQVTRIITLLNDHSVCRVIELCLQQEGDPGIEFSWLCFGSEGRQEQTLHTDQDNGILFTCHDNSATEQTRQRLLPLAKRINQALADCGFTLCKGNIMAGNPELCLSAPEWAERFGRIINSTTPKNLLASSIYFDFRVVWGDAGAAERMFQSVLKRIAGNSLFQHQMAQNALMHRPPIGRLREFILARSGSEKDTLDLKVQGLGPFVDGARLLALANGIANSNTLVRLQALREAGVIEPLDADAYVEAYHFIQLTRMQQHQQQDRDGRALSNRIDPDSLNHLDRRILRESFRQAKRLQASIALRYNL
ncbi:putative nucleotidyltransferase substrate binding domain-containing protein [Pseudomonas neustonica]|uniref:CBS domain-containing protein n=1 Tax=Pseudomonas neustonica TaxID=2487346 RepID=A0ABX9XL40_9PSED|nr:MULTISPECIES: putative nucleotidyltransferase substrate binding domain-containing protein [Pseudomonas]MAB24977.1 cyclic nucleotide-binding protein [Pseudomonadales bacterium]MBA6419854.1 CBS domain-containing protein [Pseudomonas sp. 5Ae-yellow]ROZ83295.1 CBS domain-containing protein [Pseudomonas sp. SSM44]ROZ85176.1 CBS domain-containing protein [Pseudomonas neustonica]|tara:strand:- start:153 stop:2087 length:1935 start_codon:yes stop_codon:yes gene_type:complete